MGCGKAGRRGNIMGGTKWTNEQQKAIEARDSNLLVAAAAGAGKTAVLVERIIQRVLDIKEQVDIDKLLVVTFTNAAASEMRERIGDALASELEKSPDSKRLQRQIALLNRASITTIHSFCLEVIRNHFHSIDLDPAFRIADEGEAQLLKQESLQEVFDEEYENGTGEEFLNLVECYGGGRGDGKLQTTVLKLYEFSRSMPHPFEWIEEMVEKFNPDDSFDFNASVWAKVLMEDISIEIKGLSSMMEKALRILDGAPGVEPYIEHIKGELTCFKNLEMSCKSSWDELYAGISSFEFQTLPRCKKDADRETQDKVKSIRNSVKDRLKKLKEGLFTSTSKDIKEEMRKLYPSMCCLANLVSRFSDRFSKKKKEKAVIDFSDIEHYCISILTSRGEGGKTLPTKAALEYRERFLEILIDEYQDSNMVQELILTTISRKDSEKPNIFMVGDVKQSIYRFRQAKPELFLYKYNTYSDEEEDKNRRILLYKNFRSRREVIDGVNYIFKGIMSKKVGELEYDDREKLNPGAEYGDMEEENALCGGPIELHIIESGKVEEDVGKGEEEEEEEPLEEEEDLDSIQLEARMVAGRIKELVNPKGNKWFKVFDRNLKSYRPVQYKDIVILMRATYSSAPVFLEELGNSGIPVYADTGSGYFDAIEVDTILSLLQVIDNPLQDIPLLGVLRSSVVSFTPEELIDIRLADKNKYFYEALEIVSKQEDNELSKKAGDFIKSLKKWRDKSLNMSTSEFIWYLYNDTGYYAYTGAMPAGAQRQANLRILFERAREYEETSLKGLFNFINFINKLKRSSSDMGSARILGENENVVRIMSIHKSKGLEFPVTIVCGLGKKFNMMDLNDAILFHHELGFGPDYVDGSKRYYYQTIIKQALKKKIRLESLSEEMRILYVAFTRAKEKLILTGTVNNVDKFCGLWGKSLDEETIKISSHQVVSANSFLDWICPVLMKHPDCGELREAAGIEGVPPLGIVEDDSKWEIKLWPRQEVLKKVGEKVETEAAAGLESGEINDSGYKDEVIRRLEWEYSYKDSSAIPAKLSVTELKRRFGNALEDEYTRSIFISPLSKKPSFLEDRRGLTGAEKGTIMHLVMQHINLDGMPSLKGINGLLENMVQRDFMTAVQAESVDVHKILGFFKSNLGERLIKSGSGKREVPFYMEIGSTEVYRNLPEDRYGNETILIQGIIDCYFEEDDGLVLIDYKTDYVAPGNKEDIREKYSIQIDCYARALEKMTGKKVKEKCIYLFSKGEVIRF